MRILTNGHVCLCFLRACLDIIPDVGVTGDPVHQARELGVLLDHNGAHELGLGQEVEHVEVGEGEAVASKELTSSLNQLLLQLSHCGGECDLGELLQCLLLVRRVPGFVLKR